MRHKAVIEATEVYVKKLYKDLVNPGVYAGPTFVASEFPIEVHITNLLYANFRKSELKVAAARARDLWDELLRNDSEAVSV